MRAAVRRRLIRWALMFVAGAVGGLAGLLFGILVVETFIRPVLHR